MHHQLLALPAAAAILLAATSLQAQKINDTILRTNGQRERGVEVLEMTASSVRFSRGGSESTLPATEVIGIDWFSPPESFQLAESASKRGDYTNAANLYAEAANGSARDVFKAEAQFLAGQALVRAATTTPTMAAEAVKRLEAWRAAHADGYRLPDVLLELGRAQRLAGAADASAQTLTDLENTVLEKSLTQIWVARAKLEKARGLTAQQRVAEARTAYRSVANTVRNMDTSGSGPMATEAQEIATAATVGEGETFITEGEFQRALDYFNQLTRDSAQPGAVQAAAWAGVGQALFLKAEAAGNTEGLRQAQVALARANLRDALSGQTTAKSYFYMGKILLALGEAREGSDYRARAFGYFETIGESYQDTPWALRAQAELKSN